MRTIKEIKFRTLPDTYYIWVGGSCDYAHKERCGGGAYIMEFNEKVVDTFVISSFDTTEFRMMLTVMLHAMYTIPPSSSIVFLTNVAYIQNFDNLRDGVANSDLIEQCIEAKKRHSSVTVKIVGYHKFHQLPDTHEMAHEAMNKLRRQ